MKFEYDKLLDIYIKTGGYSWKIDKELKDVINESGWEAPTLDRDNFSFSKTVEINSKENGKRNRTRHMFVKMHKNGDIRFRLVGMTYDREIVGKILEETTKLIYTLTKYEYIK